jgi:dipeptidyl aminopeptidase/acylaminoacyl peptidase
MLAALRYQNKVVELVRVPEASHVVFATAAPHHRYLQWILLRDWFDSYVKEARETAEPEQVVEAAGLRS